MKSKRTRDAKRSDLVEPDRTAAVGVLCGNLGTISLMVSKKITYEDGHEQLHSVKVESCNEFKSELLSTHSDDPSEVASTASIRRTRRVPRLRIDSPRKRTTIKINLRVQSPLISAFSAARNTHPQSSST